MTGRGVSRGHSSRLSGEGPNGRKSETTMDLDKARPQMARQLALPLRYETEGQPTGRSGEAESANQRTERSGRSGLMDEVVSHQNLWAAMKRVKKNGGSPGVDDMSVRELPTYLRANEVALKSALLDGTYSPSPVQRRFIPKRGGGQRMLGIPTALDRLVQQAVLQVLEPRLDPTFSDHSYGFRRGRRVAHALYEAQSYIREGRTWVVDADLEKFFDRVQHDVLMSRLARRIRDPSVLGLIRRFLRAGMMVHGVVVERHEGTPQGGPLSPLLANVLLDEVDKELEKRGHAFVRYADDLNVYVRSQRAGERVLRFLRRIFGQLQLRLNEAKSGVDDVRRRSFLGFCSARGKGGVIKWRISKKAIDAFKERVRATTRRGGGRSIGSVVQELRSYMPGWARYFRLADTPTVLRSLDGWLRRRLRALHLAHWKTGPRTYRALLVLGCRQRLAASIAAQGRHRWKGANGLITTVLDTSYFDELGVPRLST